MHSAPGAQRKASGCSPLSALVALCAFVCRDVNTASVPPGREPAVPLGNFRGGAGSFVRGGSSWVCSSRRTASLPLGGCRARHPGLHLGISYVGDHRPARACESRSVCPAGLPNKKTPLLQQAGRLLGPLQSNSRKFFRGGLSMSARVGERAGER